MHRFYNSVFSFTKVRYFFSIIFSFISLQGIAQQCNRIFENVNQIVVPDSNNFLLRVENTNLMKNNEYFNKFVEGYTFIGYFLHPRLVYFPSSNTKIETGIHLLKYSGIKSFTQTFPTFQFQYKAGKKLDIVFGTIYGTVNHKLIEPLFQFDRYITEHIENGLQFLWNSNSLQSDLWVNWEQFIFPQSAYQEKFTIGFVNTYYPLKNTSGSKFYIPFQMIATLRGGQNISIDANLESIFNFAGGIGYSIDSITPKIHKFSIEGYALSFTDASPSKQLPYINGRGFFINGTLSAKNSVMQVGWWFGDFFYSSRGESIYKSVSDIDLKYSEPKRALITAKFQYGKTIAEKIKLGVRLESFYDLYNGSLDYAYGVYLTFNRDFLFGKY